MKRDTVAERLSFTPALPGAMAWSSSRLIYRPDQPLVDGAHYTVNLQGGAEAEGGRKLLDALRFSFTVVGGRVAYLAPEDGNVRDVWMRDLSGGEPDQLTHSMFGVLAFAKADTTAVAGGGVIVGRAGAVVGRGGFGWATSVCSAASCCCWLAA